MTAILASRLRVERTQSHAWTDESFAELILATEAGEPLGLRGEVVQAVRAALDRASSTAEE